MASLVIGAIGAYAGSALGGYFALSATTGAEIGWMLGSALGNSLSQPTIKGPRMNDLRVQVSTYGKMIPIVFGRMRLANNVIWSTPKQEHSHTSGKGGPKQETYSYTISQAISICEGPILGIRKIWANGKLIYNLSDTADANTIIASGQAVQNGMVVYLGDEIQLPDPTIESYMGIGNVPAYRGQAYLVITDFDLSPYGGQPPNFEFEVVSSGSSSTYSRTFIQEAIVGPSVPYAVTSFLEQPEIDNGVITVRANGFAMRYSADGAYLGAQPEQTFQIYPYYRFVGRKLGNQYVWFDGLGAGYLKIGSNPASGGVIVAQRQDASRDDYFGGFCVNADGTRLYVIIQHSDGTAYLRVYDESLSILSEKAQTTMNPIKGGGYQPFFPGGNINFCVESDNRHLWLSYVTTNRQLQLYYIEDSGALTLLHDFTNALGQAGPSGDNCIVTADNGVCAIVGAQFTSLWNPVTLSYDSTTNTVGLGVYTRVPLLTSQSESLSSIVENLAGRVNVSASEIDVTQLTDAVDGYMVDQQMSSRAAIEQLMLAYHFDAVETDA